MFSELIDYTVSSTDPNNYNKIFCNLTAPPTKYSIMTITCLTTNCNIIVLNKDDYIIINDIKYQFKDNYTNINLEAFIELLKDLTQNRVSAEDFVRNVESANQLSLNGIDFYIDNTSRLYFYSERPFVINDASYNVKLITGIYHQNLPLTSSFNPETDKYYVQAISSGFNLLTPVLYLCSNIAIKSYRNADDSSLNGSKIVMRVNNSFSTSMPIINNNADFETVLLSNDLSMLEFRLVDANMHDIHLLSPLYLSVQVRSVADTDIDFVLSSFHQMVKQSDNP